jgi:uncharacterized protein (UPF0332 family)/predicted nucleotidyltransferase
MTTRTSDLQLLYEETAREFAQRIRARLGDDLHSVVLYGSVARQEAAPERDIDVLVLSDTPGMSDGTVQDIGNRLDEERDYKTHVSPLVISPVGLEELRIGGFPIARHIIHEGIVLSDDGAFRRWRDKGAMPTPGETYVRDRLDRSLGMLRDARILLEAGSPGSAADRAYYSMLHATEAALGFRGIEPARSHQGVVSQLGEHLIKSGSLEKAYSDYLTGGYSLRMIATYGSAELTKRVEREDAERLVANAQEFIDGVSALIGTSA